MLYLINSLFYKKYGLFLSEVRVLGTIEMLGRELQKELILIQTCDSDFSSMHTHPFFEFVYVLRGRAEHTINDRTMILSEGDYFLVDLNCRHEYRKLSDEADFCIVNCMFLPQFIDEDLRGAKRFTEIAEYCVCDFGRRKESSAALSSYHDRDGFVGALIRRMMRECRDRDLGSVELLKNSLVSLMVCMARNETAPSESGAGYITRYIKRYTDKHFSTPLCLSDISRELGLSLTYVSLKFKQEAGMTFRDYLKKVRIEKACRYLRTKEKTVAEIAETVGYSDAAFFFKIFKKELGVTPHKYRELHKK